MRYPTFLAAIALTLVPLGVTPATAGTLYNIADYSGAGLQNGVVLSGSITTDGTIGLYNGSSHIESWTFTVTNGATSRTFNSADLFATALVTNVLVDNTSIRLGPGVSFLDLVAINSGSTFDSLDWNPFVYSNFDSSAASLDWFTGTTEFAGPAGRPIAEVPEPASLTFMLAGAGVLATAGFVRRRRQTA
jgi:hypothetical protein